MVNSAMKSGPGSVTLGLLLVHPGALGMAVRHAPLSAHSIIPVALRM